MRQGCLPSAVSLRELRQGLSGKQLIGSLRSFKIGPVVTKEQICAELACLIPQPLNLGGRIVGRPDDRVTLRYHVFWRVDDPSKRIDGIRVGSPFLETILDIGKGLVA